MISKLARLFVLLAIPLAATDLEPFHGPSGEIEPASRAFFALLDLGRPEMRRTREAVERGAWNEALDAWRDSVVDRLRAIPFGRFDARSKPSERNLAFVNYLVERIDEETYVKICKGEPDLVDRFGWRSRPGVGARVDFRKPIEDKKLVMRYSFAHLRFLPLFFDRWRTGDGEEFRLKALELMEDFCLRHRSAIREMEVKAPGEFPLGFPDNWRAKDAQSSLCQADRTVALVRTLAGFAKSLREDERKREWDALLAPSVGAPEGLDLLPSRTLAIVALSLVLDHPEALLGRYEKVGAVPNQRFFGLTALAMIVRTFPEFRVAQTLHKPVDEALADFARGQFHLDGGMLEQSFNYNLSMAHDIAELPELLEGAGFEGAKELTLRKEAFLKMTVALGVPTGGLPWKGTYSPPLVARFEMDEATRAKADAQVAASWRKEFGPSASWPPSFTSVQFPYAGYTALRSSWESTSPWLFFSSSRSGRGHASTDLAAVQINAYGRWLLVNAGAPYYFPNQCPAWQRPDYEGLSELMEEGSTVKHNTITIDGLSQVKADPFTRLVTPPDTVGTRFHAGRDFDYVEVSQTEGWKDRGKKPFALAPADVTGTHRREVIFVRDAAVWVVIDRVTGLEGDHEVEQNWVLPPRITNGALVQCSGFSSDQIRTEGNAISTADPRGPNVFLKVLASRPVELRRWEGAKTPHYRGWFSRGLAVPKVPTVQVQAVSKGAGNFVFVTVVSASPESGVNPVKDLVLDESDSDGLRAHATLRDGSRLELGAWLAPRATASSSDALTWCRRVKEGGESSLIALGGKDGDAEVLRDRAGKETRNPVVVPVGFSWGSDPARPVPSYR